MRVRKEVVREGVHAYRDKSGKLQWLSATPELIKYWGESGNAMRQAGHKIPIPIEHDPSANPMTPAERLLNNAGEVESFELGQVEEEIGGKKVVKSALFSIDDIRDERVQGKIKDGTIKWSSPAFDSFTDAAGKKWEGVIVHKALTSRPAFTAQEPFQAQFSLTPVTPSVDSPPSGFCLSRAGLVCESQPGTFSPAYPVAFSLWSGCKFALEDLEGGKKEKKGVGKGVGGGKEAQEEEGEEPGEEGQKKAGTGDGAAKRPKFDANTGEKLKAELVDPEGDISIWCVLSDMLSMALGVDIGEDELSDEDGPQKLYEMLRDALKAKNAGAANPGEPPPEPPVAPGRNTGSNPILQEQQPVYMSLTMTTEEADKIADPTTRKIALELVETRKQNDALKQKAFKDAADKRQKRVDGVSRFLPEASRTKFLERVAGAQFSLGSDGVVGDQADGWLADMEAMIAGLPALLKGGQFSIEAQPKETTGQVPDERADEVRREFYGNVGLQKQGA